MLCCPLSSSNLLLGVMAMMRMGILKLRLKQKVLGGNSSLLAPFQATESSSRQAMPQVIFCQCLKAFGWLGKKCLQKQ